MGTLVLTTPIPTPIPALHKSSSLAATRLSLSPALASQVKLFEKHRDDPVLSRYSLCTRFRSQPLVLACSVKAKSEKLFDKFNQFKTPVDNLRAKLWEIVPQPAKEFPWKKVGGMMLQRLTFLGGKALKWSLITLFLVSFISDIFFAISRDRELIVPVGLFLGCIVADFLKEVAQELFQNTKEGRLVWQHLAGIGSFSVLVKFVSIYLTVQGSVFLSHIGNGGLLQVLWLGMRLKEVKDDDDDDDDDGNEYRSLSSPLNNVMADSIQD